LPVRIKRPTASKKQRRRGLSPLAARFSKYLFGGLAALAGIVFAFLVISYFHYSRITDEKLKQGVFPNTSVLFAAPQSVGVGDAATRTQMANRLRESGYGEDARSNPLGWYHLREDAIEVFPGDHSSTSSEPGVLRFRNGKISSIIALSDNSERTEYTLEPALLSALYDKNREKRRLVRYEDIPPILVQAVISIEDRRFFQHSGFDPIGIARAVFIDLKDHRKDQGASTITQQLARNLWLDAGKRWTRKFAELMITIHLEQKLTKQQILEYYVNEVNLGQRGSFAIRGFGEASQTYFGKDIRQLTLPEAATLAGLIQRPSYRNPARWPERAKGRRNQVLKRMLDNGYLAQSSYKIAVDAPMIVSRQGIETADAPYFVDLVNEQLGDQFQDRDFQDSGSKIYTTLDPDLQRDASNAVAEGMQEVEAILAKRHKGDGPIDEPQVALVCIDPHTGEVKALVGGKNYGMSQLDHAVAKRPSGSIFKPFVYAAALNTGLWDSPNLMTTSTTVEDEPKTFFWNGKDYEPTDYHKDEWLGDVTLQTAFMKSLNVPAIEVAERTGYGAVADLAHKAGLADIRATPSMALGSYTVTPLEITGAYTIFANSGVLVQPHLISRIVDKSGKDLFVANPQTKQVLDPRVSFLVLTLMEDVLRSGGSGAAVRARGFALPAAAKTGTSHDAWFAGFTSKLLCIVWVGLDDYQDIKLEGAHAALPIWTNFMKHAHEHRAYRGVTPFEVPDGVIAAQIDMDSGGLATNACPPSMVHTEYYLVGTQPVQFCPTHSGGASELAHWNQSLPSALPANVEGGPVVVPVTGPSTGGLPYAPVRSVNGFPNGLPNAQSFPVPVAPPAPTPVQARPKEKKGLVDKLKGIFK
jgi:penicillin-binding protein 1B